MKFMLITKDFQDNIKPDNRETSKTRLCLNNGMKEL